jgi:hypothetical protein
MPFDYKTASAIARYEAVHTDTLRDFCYAARQTWDELRLSKRENSSLQREIKNLLGEIDVLKSSLLEAEATPQPATTKPIASVKGWFHGECVIQALDPEAVLPAGMALYAARQPVVPDAEALARMFHESYERLADVAGYETRLETRSFNLESPNGRLMVLVCAEIRKALLSAGAVAAPQPVVDVNQQLVEALRNVLEEAEECFLAIEEEWGVTKSLKELEEAGKLPEPIIKARLALLSAGKEASNGW